MVHLGSEHLSSHSEHHACRASVIYSKHQGTSTQMVVTGFDITLQRSSEYIRLDEVNNVILDRAHLSLLPSKLNYQSYQEMTKHV